MEIFPKIAIINMILFIISFILFRMWCKSVQPTLENLFVLNGLLIIFMIMLFFSTVIYVNDIRKRKGPRGPRGLMGQRGPQGAPGPK